MVVVSCWWLSAPEGGVRTGSMSIALPSLLILLLLRLSVVAAL